MAKFASDDLEKLLNQTIYSWHAQMMLSGALDFLRFSEGNLVEQRKVALKRAREEGESFELDPPDEYLAGQYRTQLIESVELRFDSTLPQAIRYAGLVAYVTAIELGAKAIWGTTVSEIADLQYPENSPTAYLLTFLNQRSSAGLEREVADFQNLVYVRNCIAHAAGLVDRYRRGEEIRKILNVSTIRG